MVLEEIRAGREEGGIQMQEVEALNSGNNQTVKNILIAPCILKNETTAVKCENV